MLSDAKRSTFDAPDAGPQYVLSPDVIFLPVDDGSARLLDLDGDFYALPAVGAAMLHTTLAEGIDAAIGRIVAEYDADAARVRVDLAALLDKLERQGLVHKRAARARSRRLRTLAATAVIHPALWLVGLFGSATFHTAALLMCARCCFAMFGWAQTVQAWKACIRKTKSPLPDDLKDGAITAIEDAIRRWAARLPLTACKERALCCWFILCATGIPATLLVGVQLFPLMGHCWCQVGARVLTDFSDRCDDYTPVARYEGI